MVTQEQIRQWLADSNDLAFYVYYDWKKKRREVLAMDKYECQACKARGRYNRATMVHHVKHLRDRPDLALSIWDVEPDGKKVRQLVSLCDNCHAAEHPEQLKRYETKEATDTKEKLAAVKAARQDGNERLQERNNINFYAIVVFENEKDQENFFKEISIPKYEEYITADQVRRLKQR